MKLTKTASNLLLVAITVAWGLGFILVKMAVDGNMTAAILNFIRGVIFTLLTLAFFGKKIFHMSKKEFKVGLIAGVFNFFGFISQSVGAIYTTPSNNAFLTVTNVLMVPFIVWIVYKKRPLAKVFISVAVCLIGMAWLTGVTGSGFKANLGDTLSLLCAFFFAISISILGNSGETEFAPIAFLIGLTQAAGSLIFFFIMDKGVIPAIDWAHVLFPVIFLGIVCSFLAQTVQVVAQKKTSAASAALIMTLEGLFGSLFSVLFGYDRMSLSLVMGGLLIMLSLFISELDFKAFKTKLSKKSTPEVPKIT